MKSKYPASFRAPGQRSIPSTKLFRASNSCSSNSSDNSSVSSDKNKNKRGSNLSLSDFLNRKLHSTSVLPIIKDENSSMVIKKESSPLTAECNPPNVSILRDEQHDCEGRRDENGHVIEDSVFKLFNDSGGKVRKRSSESITAGSRLESNSKQCSQNHLLVLGDDPKPKKRVRGGVSCSNKKTKPFYNHYENGTGWWEPERVGVDNDEVGNTEMWEGMGSTTLGGLDWH